MTIAWNEWARRENSVNFFIMLPPSLLQAIEAHGCFSGCYDDNANIRVCIDANIAPEPMLHIDCSDCLSYHLGVLCRLLPGGMSGRRLANEVSEHLRKLRGYEWAVGGYHGSPASIWLNAAYYSCGFFLVVADRGSQRLSDLDALLVGFRHKIISPADTRMLDPGQYRIHTAYINMSPPPGPIHSVADLTSSAQYSAVYKPGYQRVTVAEFLPFVQRPQVPGQAQPPAQGQGQVQTSAATRPSPSPSTPAKVPLALGQRCSVCGEIVKERPTLTRSFIGCMC